MPGLKRFLPNSWKRQAKLAAAAYRRRTWRGRMLPSVIIVGTMKGGTTSLFHYLEQHPSLVGSYRKEVHYFDGGIDPSVDTFAAGEPWYRSNFPRAADHRGKLAFEATPLYLFNPLCAGRIARALPGARLIALLRDPTERAISHYFHERKRGREALPIAEAMDREEERLAAPIAAGDYKHNDYMHCSYQARGKYLQQLRRYEELFPAEQRFVATSEELFREPERIVRNVLEFIGVEPSIPGADFTPRHVSENRTEVDPAVRAQLQAGFRPHNEALAEHLGRDLGW